MPKRFDAATLFEGWKPRPDLHPTDEASLDAVRAGKKGMAMFVSSAASLADGDFAHWLKLAAPRGLVVTVHADDKQAHVFISRPEELWRVPAYLALWNTAFVDGRWSDASENLAGDLLGYTKAQRKAWLEARREETPAWTCATVYALLDRSQREVVETVGKCCFGPTDEIEGLSLFLQRGGELSSKAFARLPADHTLARVGLAWDAATQIFGASSKPGLVTKRLSNRLIPKLDDGLRSNVQFLTRAGWR